MHGIGAKERRNEGLEWECGVLAGIGERIADFGLRIADSVGVADGSAMVASREQRIEGLQRTGFWRELAVGGGNSKCD